jgi:hypothetical protein
VTPNSDGSTAPTAISYCGNVNNQTPCWALTGTTRPDRQRKSGSHPPVRNPETQPSNMGEYQSVARCGAPAGRSPRSLLARRSHPANSRRAR